LDGHNVVIEPRYVVGQNKPLVVAASEVVRSNPDVIVTDGNAAAAAVKPIAGSIPVVFVSGDPVGLGLIPSLSRPSGNLTGFAIISTELNVKRLELLREAFPRLARIGLLYEARQAMTMIPPIEAGARSLGLSITRLEVRGVDEIESAFAVALRERVAILWDEANPTADFNVKETEAAARAIGLTPRLFGVRDPTEFSSAFSTMRKEGVGALIIGPSPMFIGRRQRLADLAANNRLPTMLTLGEYTQAGGLMSYGPDYPDLFRRSTTYVDKILKGAKPADLPVEQPTKFELVINLKTAKALGLTMPPSLLGRADHVVE
jgi:putative ABC transport system substrate-binding protein